MEDTDYPGIQVDLSALEDRIMAMEGYQRAFIDAVKNGTGVVMVHTDDGVIMDIETVDMSGWNPDVVIVDSCTSLIDMEIGTIDHFRIIRDTARTTCKPHMLAQALIASMKQWAVEPEAYYERQEVWHEPAPKKIPFKQAPRQSFRQSMRSVNRNR